VKGKFLFFILCAALFFQTACITGGRKIGAGSAGTIIKPKTIQQLNREAEQTRAAKEKAKLAEEKRLAEEKKLAEEKLTQAKPIKIKPARSRPVPPKNNRVEPEPSPIKIPPHAANEDPFTKYSPTVSRVAVNVLPTTPPKENETLNGTAVGATEELEEPKIKVDWTKLITFYIIAAMFLTVAWTFLKSHKK